MNDGEDRPDELASDLTELLTASDICRVFGISRSTLYDRLQNDPVFPRPLKLDVLARWHEDDARARDDTAAGN